METKINGKIVSLTQCDNNVAVYVVIDNNDVEKVKLGSVELILNRDS